MGDDAWEAINGRLLLGDHPRGNHPTGSYLLTSHRAHEPRDQE